MSISWPRMLVCSVEVDTFNPDFMVFNHRGKLTPS